MKISIHGASTLNFFTEKIHEGFALISDKDNLFDIFQIHASPMSLEEDKTILRQLRLHTEPRYTIIHRPDELLLHPELLSFFEANPQEKLIFLGDLTLGHPFWSSRKRYIKVIPHPFINLDLPPEPGKQFVLGAFTAWGEMRKLDHYLGLVDEILKTTKAESFLLKIGGTLFGKPLSQEDIQDSRIEVASEFFIPHFNVQLYHLNGTKRVGESSGSLHRGITIPIIFEANGAERLEDIVMIKIDADDKLNQINFKKAALEISKVVEAKLWEGLFLNNVRAAQLNTPLSFAKKILEFHHHLMK